MSEPMGREEIAKARAAALDLDDIAKRFPKGSQSDKIIGMAIDHLYAAAAASEARLSKTT